MAVHVPTKDVKDKERLQRLHTKVDQLSTYMTVLKQKGDRTQHTVSIFIFCASAMNQYYY